MMAVIERQGFIMGPEVGAARGRGRPALARQARHRLRQRHRRAAAAAQGARPEARRRGHHDGVHLLRHRGRDPQRRRHAGLRGHRSRPASTSRPRPSRPRSRPAPGQSWWSTCSGRWRRWRRSLPLAKRHGLALIEDAAQAIGARRKIDGELAHGGRAGHGRAPSRSSRARTSAGSGDGGMMVTQDDALAERLAQAPAARRRQAVSTTMRSGTTAGSTRSRPRCCSPSSRTWQGGARARAQNARAATPRRSLGHPEVCPPRGRPGQRAHLPPVHHPGAAAGRAPGAPQGQGHRQRDLLPARAAPAALLRAPGLPARAACR